MKIIQQALLASLPLLCTHAFTAGREEGDWLARLTKVPYSATNVPEPAPTTSLQPHVCQTIPLDLYQASRDGRHRETPGDMEGKMGNSPRMW